MPSRASELGRLTRRGIATLAGGDTDTLRGAWWALRAVASTRHQLGRRRLTDLSIAPPPSLPTSASRGVRAALRLTKVTCLTRAAVLQVWSAAQGDHRDLIIGVTAPGTDPGFRAHAWLDGDPACDHESFRELTRIPPAHG